MRDGSGQVRRHEMRWLYVIDRRMQLTLACQLLAVIASIALAYVLAVYVLFDEASLEALTAEETRSLFRTANLLYCGYAVVFLGVAAVLLTHRIAGPALVIERAVRGMLRGEYEHRLSLRPRDYLESLSASVQELRTQLRDREESQAALLEELSGCLEAQELPRARELAAQLGKAGSGSHSGP